LRDLIYKESFKHQIMFQWVTSTTTTNKKELEMTAEENAPESGKQLRWRDSNKES
jgi:hypothetical protein